MAEHRVYLLSPVKGLIKNAKVKRGVIKPDERTGGMIKQFSGSMYKLVTQEKHSTIRTQKLFLSKNKVAARLY